MKKNTAAAMEIVAGITGIALLIYVLRSMLLIGKSTLPHDHLYWGYPVFQFYAENIINGQLPLWNPFTHGGEPFYPLLLIQKLIDPVPLLIVYIGRYFTDDIVTLYNWNNIIQCLIMVTGIYIVFRPLASHWLIRLSLMPVLLFSSIIFGTFHQAAGLYHFIWVPYVTHFLLKIIYHKDYRLHNWLLAAALIGLNWQSYFFAGTWIFLLFFSAAFLIFRRDLIKGLFNKKTIRSRVTAAVMIITLMMLPNIVILMGKNNYVYPARISEIDDRDIPMGGPQQFEGNTAPKDQGIIMPYKLIAHTGSFSSIWDFIQLLAPEGSKFIQGPDDKKTWGNPSEAYMYIGLLPWAIGLLGIVAGMHELKKIWLFMLAAFGLLILGPAGGLHRIIYYLYPPFWFVRHTHAFSIFFVFSFLYFYVLGLNHIYSTWGGPLFPANSKEGTSNKLRGIFAILFLVSMTALIYWMTTLEYPESNYLFLIIIFCFVIGWFLRKVLGKAGILFGLLAGHASLVIILAENPLIFTVKILLLLGIPLILLLRFQVKGSSSRTIAIIIISLLCLFGDLALHLHLTSYLYEGQKSPLKAFGLDTSIHLPEFINKRFVTPPSHCGSGAGSQSLRYLSILYRQPYVFSPVMTESVINLNYNEITADVLKNNSLEDWYFSPGHVLIPKDFSCIQDGTGGSCSRYEQKDGIREGRYSALLSPSSHSNSMLRFRLMDIAVIKGGSIKASVWVKSRNTTADAVQFDLQDGLGNVKVTSYSNSGNWENLELVTLLNENVKELLFTMNVKDTATSGAWFDEIKIYSAMESREFEKGLYSKRWNSFSLPKKYFELINMDMPPLAMKEMFAVGKPLFQFKQGVVGTDEAGTATFLSKLGPDRAVRLLDNYAIADSSEVDSTLKRFYISSSDYFKAIQKDPVDHVSQHMKNGFSYSVNEYNYNSLGMNVSSDSEGILYWSDGYDPGWHAYVNGIEIPVYRANVNFKAIVLPQGKSRVTFIYERPLINMALLAYYCSLVLSGVLALISWLCEGRRASLSNRSKQ